MSLSVSYVEFYQRGKDPRCPSPFVKELEGDALEASKKQVDRVFRSLARRNKK